MKILLADSDRDLLMSYERLLTLDGHEVQTAFDGTQVAAMPPRALYDAAVLAEDLPRVSHEDLVRMLQGQGTPVIALLTRRVTARHLLRPALPNAYLPFPFLPGDLRALLASVVEKKKSGEVFSCGGAEVDVSGFCFAGTDARLTAPEIDLLRRAAGGEMVGGRRARTLAAALNEKLTRISASARIEYTLGKGYGLVNRYE